MPRQKAPAGFIAAGAFPVSVLAHKRKTQLNSSADLSSVAFLSLHSFSEGGSEGGSRFILL